MKVKVENDVLKYESIRILIFLIVDKRMTTAWRKVERAFHNFFNMKRFSFYG